MAKWSLQIGRILSAYVTVGLTFLLINQRASYDPAALHLLKLCCSGAGSRTFMALDRSILLSYWIALVSLVSVVTGLLSVRHVRQSGRWIEILVAPPGEPPEWVRQAWVGLRLPLADDRVRQTLVSDVANGPRTPVRRLIALAKGDLRRAPGYRVFAADAVIVLAGANAEAARWWGAHAPHALKRNRQLLFRAECCRILPADNANAGML